MEFNLKNKKKVLPNILGDVDWIDLSYYMQNQDNNSGGASSMSNLLLCLNSDLLSILYKYDQQNPNFESDWTEAGTHECKNLTLEFMKPDLLKIEFEQEFIRCFSFQKSEFTGGNENELNYLSLKPKLFLNPEQNLDGLLTEEEQKKLLSSKLLGLIINDKNQNASSNKVASRSVKLPKYIKYLSILNPNLNYINDVTTLKMNSGDINVPIYSDDNLAEDVYSAKNKSFNIVNDSTISLKFLMYIDTGEVNYLIDRNDVNINYHINVSKKNKILNNNTFNLSMYEKITNFSINKLVYVKNIYSDEIVAIGKVININKNDNELIIQSIYNYINDTITITNMDEYILYKIYDCESFKLSEKYDKFKTFLKDDLITFDDLIFSNNDFQIINQLGK